MTGRFGYLVVEGPHDIEFVGRLLRPHGFDRIRGLSALDPFWQPLVPRKFPADDEDLLKRVPVPVFFATPTQSIAVQSAEGDDRLAATIEETKAVLASGFDAITGVGLLLDADGKVAPAARFTSLKAALSQRVPSLQWPVQAGLVATSGVHCGVFVLPDNAAAGTLEDLLLEAAQSAYPSLLRGARTFVDGVDPKAADFTGDDRKYFKKPAGKNKAVVACIANVLKPGKAIQVSIQDNRRLDGATLVLPRIRSVQVFLETLFDLSATTSP